MSEKRPNSGQKWPRMCALCVKQPPNQERAVSWATWLKTAFRGPLGHSQPPAFCGFQPLESLNKMPRPPYLWSFGGAARQSGQRMVGANGGSIRVPGAKRIIFSKVVPRPLGMLKQVFLAHFEPVVTCFGRCKIPECMENGPFRDQNRSKKGQERVFSKLVFNFLGCTNKCLEPILSLI